MMGPVEKSTRINRDGLPSGTTFVRKIDLISDWQIAAQMGVHLEAVTCTARAIGAKHAKRTCAKPCDKIPAEHFYTRAEADRIARHCRGVA
jgi:hypothetical protein